MECYQEKVFSSERNHSFRAILVDYQLPLALLDNPLRTLNLEKNLKIDKDFFFVVQGSSDINKERHIRKGSTFTNIVNAMSQIWVCHDTEMIIFNSPFRCF